MITARRARQLFKYNPRTGSLTWRIRRADRISIGDEARWVGDGGHRRVGYNGSGKQKSQDKPLRKHCKKSSIVANKQEVPIIPPTKNGLPAMACISAMQKCIRRGLEREAFEFAVEMIHTSKGFNTMVCNRLVIIAFEDIDTMAQPHIVPYVAAATAFAKDQWKPPNPGKSRMAIGAAIRIMARAPKSREGDHFQAAIGLNSLIGGYVPVIPDWALDGHTLAGKRKGRGLDYFLSESVRLKPAPNRLVSGRGNPKANFADNYEEKAHAMWALKEKKGIPSEDEDGD